MISMICLILFCSQMIIASASVKTFDLHEPKLHPQHHAKIYIPNTPILNGALEKSLALSISDDTHLHGPMEEMTDLLMLMGEILLNHNQLDDAYRVYQELYHIQQSHGANGLEVAATLTIIGHIKQEQGDYDAAFYIYGEILELEGITDEDIADTLFAMGLVLLEGKRYNDALHLMNEAVESHKNLPGELKDFTFIASTLDYVGEIYIRIGQLDDAINAWTESARIWAQLFEVEREADTMNSIGVAYFRIGDLAEAAKIFEKSINLYKTSNAHATTDVNDNMMLVMKNYELVKDKYRRVPNARIRATVGGDHSCIASYFLNGKINQSGTTKC